MNDCDGQTLAAGDRVQAAVNTAGVPRSASTGTVTGFGTRRVYVRWDGHVYGAESGHHSGHHATYGWALRLIGRDPRRR